MPSLRPPLLAAGLAALAVGLLAVAVIGGGSEPAVDEGGGPAPGELAIGIDGHHDAWPEEELEDRAELGAALTRVEWDLDEPPTSGEQKVLAAASEVGTRIHALLGGNELGDGEEYADWVVEFVRHWGPGGSFWDDRPELDESRYAIASIELGNEPYFGAMSAAEYADAVRPALQEVAALELPVEVLLAARVEDGETPWVDTLYARIPGLNSLFDGFASHPYWYGRHPAEPGPDGPFERLDALRRSMDRHGASGKPIHITEYGQSTAECGEECVDEETQAEHLEAMLEAVVSRREWDVETLVFFQLKDRGTGSEDREQQFGLLREDGTPKPAYDPVREAMRRQRG